MKTQRIFRYFILCIVLLHTSIALRAMSDSSRVHTFIAQWRTFLSYEEVNCHYVETCYADTVRFYNAELPKSGMCFHVLSIPFVDENLLEPGYTLTKLSDVQWRATFESANNIFGLDKFHYIEIEESAENGFLITKQSSLADDQWFALRQQFTSQTISENGKRYFILNEDSTTLPGYRLYILTDTLAFSEPECWCACIDEHTLGYYTSGNVFAAMSRKNRKEIAVMQDITSQLTSEAFQDAESMQTGLQCFGVHQSMTADSPEWIWTPTLYGWTITGTDTAAIQFNNPYNVGDVCWNVITTVQVQKRGKKIIVSQLAGVKPDEADRH